MNKLNIQVENTTTVIKQSVGGATLLSVSVLSLFLAQPVSAVQCPASAAAQGAALGNNPGIFPSDNWWNQDIQAAPVDPNSTNYLAFVGTQRRLHPDFGGEESPGSQNIYGIPYVVINGTQAKKAVKFLYADESDGVDANGNGLPFYPIPDQAITQAHWVEGGAPANVDQRSNTDRHLLLIDCTNQHLYELFNVFYNSAESKWYAGSGAFFDLKTNARRPDTWTSADASGMAIFPGLVRYEEVYNNAQPEINHAIRVTMRATNGYVYPASHRAGNQTNALPLGARLRLKTVVNGQDPVNRITDPNVKKIFRAMQKYGLIVADNGSDWFISGAFDVRWNNEILNPAFRTLGTTDFEVVQLGWKPAAIDPTPAKSANATLTSVTVAGSGSQLAGTVAVNAPAPVGGATVELKSAGKIFVVPRTATIPQGQTQVQFPITVQSQNLAAVSVLSASYKGVTKTGLMKASAGGVPKTAKR